MSGAVTRIEDTWTGLFEALSASEYHQREIGVASKSALDRLHKTPSKYLAWVKGEIDSDDDTEALAFGRAFHCALLEPDVFEQTHIVVPDFGDCRFKEAKANRDAWRRDNAGKVELSPKDERTILGMSRSVRKHPLAGAAIREGKSELTARWIDEETGLRCKARADYYVRDMAMIVDIKTTGDASARAFARSCTEYAYHRQDAFYRDGFIALDAPVDDFVFVAVEKKAPYDVAVHQVNEDGLALGRRSIRDDLATLKQCIERNHFPGYPEQITKLRLLPWAT